MGRFEINSRKLSTFEVAVNRAVSQTLAENLTLYMSRGSDIGGAKIYLQ